MASKALLNFVSLLTIAATITGCDHAEQDPSSQPAPESSASDLPLISTTQVQADAQASASDNRQAPLSLKWTQSATANQQYTVYNTSHDTVEFDLNMLDERVDAVELSARVLSEDGVEQTVVLGQLPRIEGSAQRVALNLAQLFAQSGSHIEGDEAVRVSITAIAQMGAQRQPRSLSIKGNALRTAAGYELRSINEVVGHGSDEDGTWEEVRSFTRVERVEPTPAELEALTDLSATRGDSKIIKFCVNAWGKFDDAGEGEDHWVSFEGFRPAARLRVKIKERGESEYIESVYLDEDGCTESVMLEPGRYNFYLNSVGKSRNRKFLVLDSDSERYKKLKFRVTIDDDDREMQKFTLSTEDVDERFNVALVTSEALRQYDLPKDSTFKLYADAPRSRYSEGRVHLTENDTYRKFQITKQIGYAYLDAHAPQQFDTMDCSLDSTPCNAGFEPENLGSLEYASCAAVSGFARFYAAAVWNYTSETDCSFDGVDCESGTDNFPVRHAEKSCSVDDNGDKVMVRGRGTSIDWLRQYWDVLTNRSKGEDKSGVKMRHIVEWLDDSPTMARDNAFESLDEGAQDAGGRLQSNWNNAKSHNGIDLI